MVLKNTLALSPASLGRQTNCWIFYKWSLRHSLPHSSASVRMCLSGVQGLGVSVWPRAWDTQYTLTQKAGVKRRGCQKLSRWQQCTRLSDVKIMRKDGDLKTTTKGNCSWLSIGRNMSFGDNKHGLLSRKNRKRRLCHIRLSFNELTLTSGVLPDNTHTC